MTKLDSGFYATDQGELLVVFGGRIIVDAVLNYDSETSEWEKEMMFSEGKQCYEIGGDVEDNEKRDPDEFKPVRLLFYDDKSIDVLINQLQELKSLKKD